MERSVINYKGGGLNRVYVYMILEFVSAVVHTHTALTLIIRNNSPSIGCINL